MDVFALLALVSVQAWHLGVRSPAQALRCRCCDQLEARAPFSSRDLDC